MRSVRRHDFSMGKWFIRAGSLVVGRVPPAPRMPREWIVCRDREAARQMRRDLDEYHERVDVDVIWPCIRSISHGSPWRITVMGDVDLDADCEGQGSLGKLLAHRQRRYGRGAVVCIGATLGDPAGVESLFQAHRRMRVVGRFDE